MEIILQSPKFERLWSDSTIESQQAACRYIEEDSIELLRKWVREHPSIELGEMNIRQLRERARKADVRNYSRKDKSELIIAIQFKESKRDKVRNGDRDRKVQNEDATNGGLNRDEKELAKKFRGRPFVPGEVH